MGRLMWCSQLVCLQLVLLHSLSFANLCSNEQSSALLHFKQLFSFSNSSSSDCSGWQPDYPKMKYWKEDTDCCSWEGVSCDRVTGHVISLDLSCSWLQGNIPSNTSLFLLSHLQKLNLAYNNFNLSQIPSDFVRFPSLTHLNLSDSNFSGQVPFQITHLSKLISLDLSGYHLTLETLVMKGLVQNMSHLQELSLDSVNMSTVALGTLTNINLPSMTYLSLGFCELQGTIPSGLVSLPSLETIYLYGNQLFGTIPSSIFELENLNHLWLSSGHLSGTVELSMFAKLKNLEELGLSYNSLSISTTFKVNSSFPKLQYLGLSSCNINEFPEILSTADNLLWLDLSDNKIHGHIPNWLFNISTLYHLHLSHNFLTGSIKQLPWKGLRSLDLSYNSLSMSTKVNYSFPNLGSLSLSSCNIYEFPETLSTAENLQYLDLSDNKIHGHIPNWLFNISTLYHLNVSHNFLTGIEQLPWKGLQYLDLHSNLLHGLLPPPPPKLYFFSVSQNILTGAIPSSFCNLSSLQYLELSNNRLSGVIPQCLGNSTSIYVLDLKMNNFHGSIPQTFANGCQLTTLNLNSNRLAGSLPASLANCGNLEVLDVGHNTINGTFPHWLATLSQLQVLILRSNRFYGALGDSTRLRFYVLRILDLSHNSFTGHLQTRFFKKFQAMMSGKNNSADIRYMGDNLYKDSIMVTMKGFEIEMQRVLTIFTAMDLSSNRFQGRILDVVGKLNSLIVLNFSHNNLVGHIPLSMGNLTELESLDLSSNKLDGKIPQELTSLIFLSVLNLSYNHLVGPIPQGNQFHTFQNDSYFGNLGLCGLPMSETCSNNDEPLESQPTIFHKEYDNSSWFDWKIIMMGYGSGIVIGLSIGHIVFSTGKPSWFVSMVERKAIKLTRSCRRRRN